MRTTTALKEARTAFRRGIAILATATGLFVSGPLHGQKVALLIGNNDYQFAGRLESPVKDALDMAGVLERHGYSTCKLIDATRDQMLGGIRDLKQVAQGADICLFYFSGHGLEVDGLNYLSPVDGILRNTSDLRNRLIPMEQLLVALRQTDAKRKVVVLDCCRNDPFKDRQGGLAAIESGLFPRGTMIVYAGSPGRTVADGGDGRNSPYTGELLTGTGSSSRGARPSGTRMAASARSLMTALSSTT